MVDTYKKKGNTGIEGIKFQLNLLTVFLLSALSSSKGWKISTENTEAGKYDDIVLELTDKTVLLQAKYRKNKKVGKAHIFSDAKNADFGLAKYFFSYHEIKTKFANKSLIICTNTEINDNGLKGYLIPSTVNESSLSFCEGTNCSIFSFNENILPELRTSIEAYYKNHLEGKGTDESVITDENMEMFLRNLQIVSSYPCGEKLDNVIDYFLRRLSNCSLYCKVSIQEVHKKVEDWFEHGKGEYLTEERAKSLFATIKSDQYCEKLRNYNVSFRNNNFNIRNSKGNFHITSEGRYVLQLLKIYDALKEDKSKTLYVNPESDIVVQNEVIHAFGLPTYIFLVIILTKMTETAIKRICGKLKNILKKEYKQVMLVSEGWNHQINLKNISQIDGSVTFDDFSENTQKMILNKKKINFQGRSCNLEELITQPTLNYSSAIDSEILEKLILDKEIKVGTPLINLDTSISRCYIDRRFKQKCSNMCDEERNTKTEELTESGICDINDKVIVIADSTGMGKSTILNKLALLMKKKKSHIWIIKIDLNDYSKAFENLKIAQTDTITVRELLNYRNATRLENNLERVVFSMNKKVMVMIDGIDEISLDYTRLILKMLSGCQRAPNFVKVFVTTRPHMIKQLDDILNIHPFILQPLTEQDQISFLTKYWIPNLKLDNEGKKKKCEHYARALISKMSLWTKGYRYKESSLASRPLYIRMVAEIFQESIKLNESPDWEGCKEYLQETRAEPKLPQRMGFKKLFDEFIKKKGDHFTYRGASNTTSSTANKALKYVFRKRLFYHRSLAVEVILGIRECNIFSSYRQCNKDVEQDLLNIGIVQSLEEERFSFIHRTFAEYFFSEILAIELQNRHQNVKFQTLVIEKILWKPEFRLIRTFLDSFLQCRLESLPSDIFERYHLSTRDSALWWKYNHNPIFVLAEEGCVTILQLVLKCIDFKILKDNESDFKDTSNTCNILHYLKVLVRKEGINFKDEQGGTPLHSAAQGGHLEMVQFLVTQGAKIDNRNYTAHTALHLAIWGEHLGIATLLIHEGTDVDVRNNEGRTPLHFAVIRNQFDIVKSLVDSNTQINISDKNGQTALHLAALGGHLQIVEFLVKHGADININDKYGRKALHVAALHGQLNTVKFLLFGDINIRDNNGNTALHLAVLRNQLDTVKLLAVRGLDVSIINNDGYAALHLASVNGSSDIVSFFVELEVGLYIRSNYGRTALHLAASCGQLNIVRLFAGIIDINITDDNGNTALHLAASNGELETFKLLINSKAYFTEDKHGRTPLHLAALAGHLDTIKFLVNLDIDINANDNDGSTALHLACLGGRLETVRFIVESKGDCNLMDRYGRTALHLAALSGNLEIVIYLTEIGIDVDITDRYGRTALHLAERTGKSNIINFFSGRR